MSSGASESASLVDHRPRRMGRDNGGGAAWLRTKKAEHERSRTVSSRRLLAVGSGYVGVESVYLLIGLTVSLLVLPLVLPPLPPPPFMLLLLPICILACLMMLAFMPSNVREFTCV